MWLEEGQEKGEHEETGSSLWSREVKGLKKEELGCLSHFICTGVSINVSFRKLMAVSAGRGSPRQSHVLQFNGDGKSEKVTW